MDYLRVNQGNEAIRGRLDLLAPMPQNMPLTWKACAWTSGVAHKIEVRVTYGYVLDWVRIITLGREG